MFGHDRKDEVASSDLLTAAFPRCYVLRVPIVDPIGAGRLAVAQSRPGFGQLFRGETFDGECHMGAARVEGFLVMSVAWAPRIRERTDVDQPL